MTATAPTRDTSAESRVWLVGSTFSEPVRGLLGCSRWQVEQVPNVGAAGRQIEAGSVPVVLCGNGEWREVVDAVRRSARPPAVIVLTAAPKDTEWAEVVQAGAHYLDVRNLDAGPLFSLLNLLWRGWSTERTCERPPLP